MVDSPILRRRLIRQFASSVLVYLKYVESKSPGAAVRAASGMGNINCCETGKVVGGMEQENKEDTRENVDDAWNCRRRHPEEAEAATRGSKGSAGISCAGSTSPSQRSTATTHTFSPAAPFAAVTNALLMLLRVATASNRGRDWNCSRPCPLLLPQLTLSW